METAQSLPSGKLGHSVSGGIIQHLYGLEDPFPSIPAPVPHLPGELEGSRDWELISFLAKQLPEGLGHTNSLGQSPGSCARGDL